MLVRFTQKLASPLTYYNQVIASKGQAVCRRALSSLHHSDNKPNNEQLVASDKLIKPLERVNGKIALKNLRKSSLTSCIMYPEFLAIQNFLKD